jgi:DNA invertase Pin-like site-specific DNA recombinase
MFSNLPLALYVRKSSEEDERQAQSLESQETRGRKLAAQLGFDVVTINDAHSAKEPGRPLFDELLRGFDNGKYAGLIAWHPDRLSRNEIDAAAITYRVRKKIIPLLKFVSYDFHNSNEGIMMLQIALCQSQYSSSKLMVDVQRGIDDKLKAGWYPHRAPLGYKNDTHKPKGLKSISPDPASFDLLKTAWQMLASGDYTAAKVGEMMHQEWGLRMPVNRNGRGGGRIPRTTLYRTFSNVFYTGYFYHAGELYEGKHEPMVTLEQFDAVQKLIGRNNPLKARAVIKGSYSGLIQCAHCRRRLTYSTTVKPSGRTYTYYHCQGYAGCRKIGLRQDRFEEFVSRELSLLEIDTEFFQWACESIERSAETVKERIENVRRRQAKTLKNIEEELDGLMRMCARNLIDEDEFKRKKNDLIAERDKLRHRHTEAAEREDEAEKTNRTVAEYMHNAYAWMKEGNEEAKRAIAQNLGSNYLWDGENVLPELHPLLIQPKQAHMELSSKYSQIKLDKTLSESTKKQRLDAVRSAWSRIWEVNQTFITERHLEFRDIRSVLEGGVLSRVGSVR